MNYKYQIGVVFLSSTSLVRIYTYHAKPGAKTRTFSSNQKYGMVAEHGVAMFIIVVSWKPKFQTSNCFTEVSVKIVCQKCKTQSWNKIRTYSSEVNWLSMNKSVVIRHCLQRDITVYKSLCGDKTLAGSSSVGYPIEEIRQSKDRLISAMGVPRF